MKMRIESAIASSGFAGLRRGQINASLKEEFAAAGKFWHQHYRPRHFTVQAYTLYGYQRRARGYVYRKRKKLGHNRPLVFTNVSERLSQAKTITSTSKYARVTMSMPTLNLKAKQSSIVMRREMEAIAQQEEQTIFRRFERGLTRRLAAAGDSGSGRQRDSRGRFITGS